MELNGIAYPKINIGLYIGCKRSDNYHNLISIFQLVRDEYYHDEISISVFSDNKGCINVSGLEGIAQNIDNTVFKAASLYMKNACLSDSLFISINKKIPSLAGLGGGSSDAGCVLNLLNDFYKKYSAEQLQVLALQIGSDVPFFLCASDAAVVEGRGEIITPIESRSDLVFVLHPGSQPKKSTGFAYSRLDERAAIPVLPSKDDLIAMYNSDLSCWNFHNDFEFLYIVSPSMHLTGSGSWFYSVKECN